MMREVVDEDDDDSKMRTLRNRCLMEEEGQMVVDGL